ncbi:MULTISPECIES: hypothetical protein [Streptomyces]|uniref:hypothetical protein n=1 Tax=Streptomyces TaxID=1883 RepID=UPI00167685E7|nr:MULTISPECIES: hypothetical protein [Streptomyces]MBK3527658.1 hypothetical protein [Streptomyces sp. MBT70]
MLSAVVIPAILLAVVLAPGVYEEWKAYVRQTRLPLPPARRPVRTRLVHGPRFASWRRWWGRR